MSAGTATLADIAKAVDGELFGDERAPVRDVTHDSRQVEPGWLFVAITGAKVDGHTFTDAVIGRGAVGAISERSRPNDFRGTWLRVADARAAMARAAATVQRNPSHDLNLVGITGTNGKTTTAYILHAIMTAGDKPAALLSTIESRIGVARERAAHTTPESPDVQRFLRRAVDAGCHAAVMECSSHALDLHRCDALRYAVAIWTNLTRDHLDYHETMEHYYASKRRLFDGSIGELPRSAAVNVDDEAGVKLVRELREGMQFKSEMLLTYALEQKADVTATDVQTTLDGLRLRLHTPHGARDVSSPLVGRAHAYNILAATTAALALGYNLDYITNAIERCTGAPGRFERVSHEKGFIVAVDYAHTDDALRNTLRTAREVAPHGRIITVFGCGGDRDRTKRFPMGEAAATLSDIVVLTSDNPRHEDPNQIFHDVEAGLSHVGKPYRTIPDRRAAIHEAIELARPGDLVLIAGKGHEDYQIIGDEVLPFDDREVAREALEAK